MSLVRFTRPDGEPCLINPETVEEVQPAPPGYYDPAARTLITCDGASQPVTEPFEEVARKLGVTR